MSVELPAPRGQKMNFLGFPDWQIVDVTEDAARFFVRAVYVPPRTSSCLRCDSPDRARRYGVRARRFVDAPVRGKTVAGVLSVQRYRCSQCGLTFLDRAVELKKNSRLTERLVSYIERQSVGKNFLTVARETGVSENTVREIFTRFVERAGKRSIHETPAVLGIDDVYIGGVSRCILTDIERKKVINLLPKRDMSTIYGCLIQMGNKKNVKVVTMDMCRPFFETVKSVFLEAEVVIDTFHIQRMANQAVNTFLKELRVGLNSAQRRAYLHDRFILLKRSFNLTAQEKHTLLKWKKKLPPLAELYDLKEQFLGIWRFKERAKAETAYDYWEESIPFEIRFAFQDIITAFENWHHEIFNYFDFRVTNAFTESANNLIKNIEKQGRGYTFEVIRAKILYKHLGDIPVCSEELTDKIVSERIETSRIKRLQIIREWNDKFKDL